MKKMLLFTMLGLSMPAFGMSKAFNALCTGIRYAGASYFPLTMSYGHIRASLASSEEENTGIIGSLDQTTNTWIEEKYTEPKNYQFIDAADSGKKIPVEKTSILTIAGCRDHTLSHLMGNSKYPYSVVVPNIFPLERLTNNDSSDRGLTVSEYQQSLENNILDDPVKDLDGMLRKHGKLIESLTKEEMEAILQHEKGHGERNAGLRKAGINALTIPSIIGADHILMKKVGKNVKSLKKPLLRSATKLSVSALLGCLYHHTSSALYYATSRYEEYKADDNVQKKHIPAQISFFQKTQITDEIIARECKKNKIEIPGLVKEIASPDYYATHPTDTQRIARLQKRLET